jgi:hypothetical protein
VDLAKPKSHTCDQYAQSDGCRRHGRRGFAYLEVAIGIEQQVGRLQVTVNDCTGRD